MVRVLPKFSALISVLIIFFMLITGCGFIQREQNGTASTALTENTLQASQGRQPYEFSVFRSTWTNMNEETDLIIKELNKILNVKIRILSAPYEAWVEKYNLLVSSGQVPDLSVTTGPGTMNFNEWAKQGIYLDITELYPKYCPDAAKYINKEIIEAHKIDGRLYGIPKPQISDVTWAIRADWLRKLKLPMPETIDDLYNVLKAFRDDDPDGNQKNDTHGLFSEDTLNTISIIFGAFGCSAPPNIAENWVPDGNGGLTSAIMVPGMKDAIKFITKLYRDKILDQEWMITKSQGYVDKIQKGKVGFMSASFQTMISNAEAKMKTNDPAAELAILDGVTGPDGKYVRQMQKGYYMVSSISSKAANPQKILEFINYLMTEEGNTLLTYGVEGVTYKKEGEKIIPDQEALKFHGIEGGHNFKQIMQPAVLNFAGNDPRLIQIKEKAKVLLEGPYYPLPTIQPPSLKEVTTKLGADFVKNSVTAVIVGKGDPEAEWDRFINKWRESGGDLLIKEINEIYAKTKK